MLKKEKSLTEEAWFLLGLLTFGLRGMMISSYGVREPYGWNEASRTIRALEKLHEHEDKHGQEQSQQIVMPREKAS